MKDLNVGPMGEPELQNLLCMMDGNCNINNSAKINISVENSTLGQRPFSHPSPSMLFYTVMTPLIIVLGCVGNILCIWVFSQKRLRRQTASFYFATLSGADLAVLLLYVLPDWLQKQPYFKLQINNLFNSMVVCHVYLFLSYSLRLLSVWMLVTSTIERYIGVSHPLLRRRICTVPSAKKIITSLFICGFLIGAWKPATSTVWNFGNADRCIASPDLEIFTFVMDVIYAGFLTVVPTILIFIFNILISKHLIIYRRARSCVSHQDVLGTQFAALLVLVSSSFLVLTWPYYICWIIVFINTRSFEDKDHFDSAAHEVNHHNPLLNNALYYTRTVYYATYSVNFFLYTYASTYFRTEMKRMFTLRENRDKARAFYDPKNSTDQSQPLKNRGARTSRGAQSNLLTDRYNKKVTIKRMPTMRKPMVTELPQQQTKFSDNIEIHVCPCPNSV